MIIDSHISQTLSYPLHLLSPHYASPLLNKILTNHPSGSIFSAYSDGQILQHSQTDGLYQFRTSWQPYQNAQIIDIKTFSETTLALCTHTEVTLYDLVKNRNTSLKGHQSTPLAVSCHPVSPVLISVSSLLIEHDVRMAKPINVNFVTPPVYSVEYFTDGQYYVLSGEPCRIGRDKWHRTLLNGISTPSINSKYILSNDLEGSITLWEWRTSKSVLQLQNIKNTQTYQPIHFGLHKGNIEQILFLEDDGTLLRHDICKNVTSRHKIIERVEEQDNWKMEVKNINYTTKELIVYEHSRAITQVVKLSELGKETGSS